MGLRIWTIETAYERKFLGEEGLRIKQEEKMRLNLLQHLTGENFHKTYNFYVLFVMISPLRIKTR